MPNYNEDWKLEPVFYSRGKGVIDTAFLAKDGQIRSSIFGHTLADMTFRYQDVVILTAGVAAEMQESAHKTAPKEIKEEEFLDALDALPPLGWQRAVGCESFKLIERVSGCVTSIYARIEGRYFVFNDVDSMPHEQIILKCKLSMGH